MCMTNMNWTMNRSQTKSMNWTNWNLLATEGKKSKINIPVCMCVLYLNFLGISVRLCCNFFFSRLNSAYFTYIWGEWVRQQKKGRQQWLEIRPGNQWGDTTWRSWYVVHGFCWFLSSWNAAVFHYTLHSCYSVRGYSPFFCCCTRHLSKGVSVTMLTEATLYGRCFCRIRMQKIQTLYHPPWVTAT